MNELIERMDVMKKKVLLVTFSDNADHQDITFGMYEQLIDENVYLIGIKEPKVSVQVSSNVWFVDCPKRPGVCRKTFDIVTLFKLINKIKKEQFDVIFFESLHVWNLPIMLFCKKRSNIFQMIHDVIPHKGDKGASLVDFMNKIVCKLAHNIILCNEKYVQTLCENYKIAVTKVKSIDMWRRYGEYNSPIHSNRVLFFGRINPYKGANNLLEIVNFCPNVHFDVVGKVDSQVEELIVELRKQKNVSVKSGYVSDEEMKAAFIDSDWVIVPYNTATQSGVIVDAYKYSRPVIAFNVGAVEEQVEDGKSGFLVEAGNNVAFANKINEVSNMMDEELDAFAERAYQYGIEKYSALGAKNKFMDILGI